MLRHIDGISLHEPSRHLLLDPATRRNLEIERSIRDGGRAGSLLHSMDETLTSAGARLLRQWLLAPLTDPAEIARRLDAVQELLENGAARLEARERLKPFQDVERLLGRAVTGTANARDLIALGRSLGRLPSLAASLARLAAPMTRETLDRLDPCDDLAARLEAAVAEAPPVGLREGGLIRDGFDAELDELRAIRRDGRAYIAAIEAREREATGIASLKVRFNKVFGYYIEVSRPNLHLVPDHYQRKQTIAGGERFVTPELKEHEAKVLNAQERIESLEYEIFCALRAEVAAQAHRDQERGRGPRRASTCCRRSPRSPPSAATAAPWSTRERACRIVARPAPGRRADARRRAIRAERHRARRGGDARSRS